MASLVPPQKPMIKTKKILFCAIFLVATSPAMAAHWAVFNEQPELKRYVDVTSVKNLGDGKVSFFVLTDLLTNYTPKPGTVQMMSLVTQMEFDCKTDKFRNVFGLAFAGNMATGDRQRMPIPDGDKWMPVVPDTEGVGFREFACKR